VGEKKKPKTPKIGLEGTSLPEPHSICPAACETEVKISLCPGWRSNQQK